MDNYKLPITHYKLITHYQLQITHYSNVPYICKRQYSCYTTDMSIPRKLSIGVQSFKVLRNDRYLYVDKTAYIAQLVASGRVYFLSRPRQNVKSCTSLYNSCLWVFLRKNSLLFRHPCHPWQFSFHFSRIFPRTKRAIQRTVSWKGWRRTVCTRKQSCMAGISGAVFWF